MSYNRTLEYRRRIAAENLVTLMWEFNIFQMSTSFLRDVQEATKKWGRVKIRPQASRKFLHFRQSVNHKVFPTINPNAELISNWKLNERMIERSSSVARTPKYSLITNTDTLKGIQRELKTSIVLGVDTESSSSFSYVAFLCLLQISTSSNDFIIDCILLHDEIYEVLRDVFADPNILKIVHGIHEVQGLQRDFNIYSVGVIDLQEVHYMLYKNQLKTSLADIVKQCFNVNLQESKIAQFADWRLRPLPDDLLQYAASDSRWILRCWEKFRDTFGQQIVQMDFTKSLHFTKEVYKFPNRISDLSQWKSYINSLNESLERVFNIVGHRALFLDLMEWRRSVAKMVDRVPTAILDVVIIQKLCRFMPKKDVSLAQFFINHQQASKRKLDIYLGKQSKSDLLQIIIRHRREWLKTENRRYLPELEMPKSSVWSRLTRQEVEDLTVNLDDLDYSDEDISSDDETVILYNSKEISRDIRSWNIENDSTPKVTKITAPEVQQKVVNNMKEPASTNNVVNNTASTVRDKKLMLNRKRNGKLQKVKRVFHLAVNIGVSKEDLLKYLDKFPTRKNKN